MAKNIDINQNSIRSAWTRLFESTAAFIDSINFGTIFSMFFTPLLHQFLEEIGKYFLFPIAAAAHVVKSALMWRDARLNGMKSGSVVPAIVETLAAAAIVAAVVGGLVSGLFAMATPIIFAATIAAKTLYQIGAAIYYAGKASMTSDPADKKAYYEKVKTNVIGGVAGMVATAAVALVFVFGKFALAAIGVAAGVLGGALAVYKGVKAYQDTRKGDVEMDALEPNGEEVAPLLRNTSTSSLLDGMGHDKNPGEQPVISRPDPASAQADKPAADPEQYFGHESRRNSVDGNNTDTVVAATSGYKP